MSKHIAMWSAPRSRSTAITRAFGQIATCRIWDEPLYGPYLLTHGFDHPDREDVLRCKETDYEKIIERITGDLPKSYSFSFQKHIAKIVLPEFGRSWLANLNNFFLIRHPKEIILSYHKIHGHITFHDAGMEELYNIFKAVWSQTGKIPLVIHSNDIVRAPAKALQTLCNRLEIPFSESMLSWQPNFEGSKLLFSGPLLPHAETWYATVMKSRGFIPYREKKRDFPDEFRPLLQACMPFYEELLQYSVSLIEC